MAMSRVAVMSNEDAMIEVGLTLASIVSVLAHGVVQVVGVVVQAVFKQIKKNTLVVMEVSLVGRVPVNMDTHPVVAVGLALTTIVVVSVKLELQVAGVVVHAAVEVLKTKTRQVVAVLAVVRIEVKTNKHTVVVAGIVMAAMAAVTVKVEVRVVGVVVHAPVKVLKTKTRPLVAVLAMSRVAVMTNKDAVIEVGLTLAEMVAVSVEEEVQVVGVVVQEVFKQFKNKTLVVVEVSAVGRVAVTRTRTRWSP